MMHALLRIKLRWLAHLYLRRYKPMIIAITGNVGKTTTKEAIASVLSTRFHVRSTGGNLNNELGIPLTIIGDHTDEYYTEGGTIWFWKRVLWRAFLGLFRTHAYPDVLVLEFGADRPGDIRRYVRDYPPHIAVVTRVGDVPVHVEFFASPHELAQEKAQLVAQLTPSDIAILGVDDASVVAMRSQTKGRVRTFGVGEGADVQITNFKTRSEGTRPVGVAFDISVDSNTMPVTISGALGEGLAQAAAAAVAVATSLHSGLADTVQALARMTPPPGRMRILEGIRSTVIIDDTYNASPAAMQSALDAVRTLPASRKVLVLGDMRELGSYSAQAHQAIGEVAAGIATVLVCVGTSARFIADAAAGGMPPEHIHRAQDAHEAAALVQQLIRQDDLILVKGSQGMRMERIVQEIMARPEQASRLLVRQSARWLAK